MNRLSQSFFAATVGGESWSGALNQLANAFGGFESHFMIWDRVRSRVDFSGWAEFTDEATEPYSRCEALIQSRRGEVILTQELPDRVFLQDPIYIDFLQPLGTRYIMGLKLAESGSKVAMLRIHRSARHGPFSELESRRLEVDFRNLSRAAQTFVRRFELIQASAVAAACLDQLSIGTIVIDRGRRVLYANGIAEKVLEQNANLMVRDGILVLGSQDATEALMLAISDTSALPGCCPKRNGNALQPLCVGEYELTICPLSKKWSAMFQPCSVEAFLLTFKRTERLFAGDGSYLKSIFGLTNSEATIAEEIVLGRTLRQIAGENSISVNTVKTHLKAVFAKMGARSQSDLIRIALGH